MEDLSEKFIDEANELLEKLEESLLELENNPEDNIRINEVFRVMHSLKGTGAMFGFGELSSFTHELESVYELVRSHKLEISKHLLDITFKSIDMIKSLLHHADQPSVIQQKEVFVAEIRKEFLPGNKEIQTDSNHHVEKQNKTKKKKTEFTYFIQFQPGEGVLKDGTHPLYLIDELLDLGKGEVFLHLDHLPDFEKIVPDLAYLYWDFLLVTSESENTIKDVFIFVEDNSLVEIRKIADFDLISQKGFKEAAKQLELEKFIDNPKLGQLVSLLKNHKSEDISVPEPKQKQKLPESDQVLNPKSIPSEKISLVEEMHTVRVSSKKLDKMLDIISEMLTAQARLEHLNRKFQNPDFQLITETFQKISRQLRENTLEMRLIPIYSLVTRFKRLVRDLSGELGKNVRLETKGTETELDKSLIEKLYDPLMHIIRNSLDHGLELPEERHIAGKPEEGLLQISTFYSGTNVVIEVSDDGRGINLDEVRLKALERDLIQASDILGEKELLNILFLPGFSTSREISNVSGRGVGLDVVKKNISELRGDVEIMTIPGKGTTFKIILPLTLSIIDGLLVFIGEMRYLIPIENISRIFELKSEEISQHFNRVIIKGNRQIPYVNLVEVFAPKAVKFQQGYLLVVNLDGNETGIIISSIVGKQQAVIKPLNKFIQGQNLFLGATVLGDGEVALVLDAQKTIQKYTFN